MQIDEDCCELRMENESAVKRSRLFSSILTGVFVYEYLNFDVNTIAEFHPHCQNRFRDVSLFSGAIDSREAVIHGAVLI